jgi:hypothetical protein
MNIWPYVPRLTDETTKEYNIDEYMALYSSVGTEEYKNIFIGYV